MEVLEDRIVLATFLVVNSLDGPPGSLRYAITQADQSGSGTNRVIITSKIDQPIILTKGQISFGNSLSIVNQAGHQVEIRQTTPGARVFDITDSGQFFIGAASSGNMLTIDGGNIAGGNGGGIFVENAQSVLTLRNVALVDNSATITAMTDTTTMGGGGIYSNGQLALDHSLVDSNQTNGTGGGIFANGDVTISYSHVNQNQGFNVGGINVTNGAVSILKKSQVNNNSSSAPLPHIPLPIGEPLDGNFGGGAIAVGKGSVLVSQSEVNYNQAESLYCSGIVILFGSVTISDGSQVNWNRNSGPGGGIAVNFGGSVTVTGRSQVDHNTGAGMGGGIVNFASSNYKVEIDQGSEVSHNTLTNAVSIGEVIIIFLDYLAGLLQSDYQTLTGFTTDQSEAMIQQVEAEIGSAHGTGPLDSGLIIAGGGIGTLLGASVTIGGKSRVEGNYSGFRLSNSVPGGTPNASSVGIGGGIATFLGQVDVDQSSVSNNTSSEDGGGIWNRREVSITRSIVANNTALGETLGALGGGLFQGVASIHSLIENSAFTNNGAVGSQPSFGGGLYNMASITVRGSAISRNYATLKGGGIADFGRQLRIVRSIVTHNNATVDGGGIIYDHGYPTLRRSRVVANTPNNIAPA